MGKRIYYIIAAYVVISISIKLSVYYTGNQLSRFGMLSHLITLVMFIPFILFSIYAKRKENGGFIAGKEAVKQGLSFTIWSTLIMCLFNYIFFEVEMGKFFIAEASKVNYDDLLKEALKYKKDITMEQVVANQKEYLASISAFRDTTFKLFGYLFFGLFASFVGGAFLKKG